VHVSAEARARAQAWLAELGFKEGEKLIAVHPGMGGSALNWPENHYIDFVRAMVKEDRRVVLTGGPTEGALLNRVRDALGDQSGKVWIYGGNQVGAIDGLGAVFAHASLVVAPSTGPLHLAVALGKPVVTFYPPVRVQSALRWGPYLKDEKCARVLVPEVFCGQDFHCLGSLCNYYPCMKSLTVSQAIQQANSALAQPDEKALSS
jgi:ADP-heptose:LPS heptosyltransferase